MCMVVRGLIAYSTAFPRVVTLTALQTAGVSLAVFTATVIFRAVQATF